MAKGNDESLISAVDIGTSKVVALVAEVDPDDNLTIMGIGSQPSRGLKKGVIVNIDSTVNAIQKAVEEAEQMANGKISSVSVGIAGSHIRSFDSNGVVAVKDEVNAQDLDRVMEAAKAVPMPADQKILHILPQDFIIDGQAGIREPKGMAGVRLEAKVHMVTGSVSAVQNIIKCVNRCGVEPSGLVLEQLASSYATLSEDEKEMGVCLIDIGGGTTDVAVFIDGAIRHTSVIPMAGMQVTSDIAHALRTAFEAAEDIKLQHGCALSRLVKSDDAIEVPGIAGRSPRRLPLQSLTEVIEARSEEILSLVYENLNKAGLIDQLSAGVVITGGASKLSGMVQLAEEIFKVPVRLGVPQNIFGLDDVRQNPMHATGVGLLLYERNQRRDLADQYRNSLSTDDGVWSRMKNWFGKHF